MPSGDFKHAVPVENPSKDRCTGSFIATCLIVICCFVLLGILTTPLIRRLYKNELGGTDQRFQKTKVCRSLSCYRMTKEIQGTLTPAVAPCTDFYSYVCTGWTHNNVKGANVTWLASKRFVEQIETALKLKSPSTTVQTVLDMVVLLYQSCITSTTAPLAEGMKVVFDRLKITNWPNFEHTDWESFDVFTELMDADINSGTMLLFKFERSYGWNSEIIRTSILPTPYVCPYEKMSRNLADLKALELEYAEYVTKVFELFKHTYSVAAKDVANIQISLCNVLSSKATFSYYTFGDIVARTKKLGLSKDDWLNALKPLGKFTDATLLHTDVDYIETALSLTLRASPEIPMKFIGFAILQQMAWVHDDLRKIREQFSFVREPAVSSAVPTGPCSKVILTHFRKAWNIFAITIANPNSTVSKDVDQLIRSVKSAAIRRVRSSAWMDETSKSRTISKLITTTLLSPSLSSHMKTFKMTDHFKDLEALTENFFDNLLKIRRNDAIFRVSGLMRRISEPNYALAGGDVDMDRVSVLAGLVQLPFYARELPIAIKYGGIGAITGGLVAMIITGEGISKNEIGTTSEWWSGDTYREYKRRAFCFAKQTDPTSLQEEEPRVLPHYLGLRIAFDALQYARMDRGTQVLLPTFLGAEERLFFITYCLGLCGSVNVAGELSLPLQSFRLCNEAVRNMPEFSEAFRCPHATTSRNATMNPNEKCELY
ncbi:endothelin-converting enzyme homolog [Ixodes scapularis]|uniref:endothelin-converting enzyme homolog n=1 Tax=Ixodes scapularis TaxID=6945 RepID=UPI001A9D9FD2|nr:endothelin-converting enzyme homolog [Ixodes scapularis]